MDCLTAAGRPGRRVWQPADWHSGWIAAELEALSLPPGQAAAAVVSYDPDPERAFFRALYGSRS